MLKKSIQFQLSKSNNFHASVANEKLEIKTVACQRNPFDFRTECQFAARELALVSPNRLTLAFDGSPLSVSVFKALQHAQVPFQCSIVRFQHAMNIQTVSQAVIYCEEAKITSRFIEMDVHKLLSNGSLLSLAKTYRLNHIVDSIHIIQCAEILRAHQFPIFAMGFPRLQKTQLGWNIIEKETDFCLHRFCHSKGISAAPTFFRWSPELYFSILNSPMVRSLVMNRFTACTDFAQKRQDFISEYFRLNSLCNFSIDEKIIDENKRLQRDIMTKAPVHIQQVTIPYAVAVDNYRFKKPIAPIAASSRKKPAKASTQIY